MISWLLLAVVVLLSATTEATSSTGATAATTTTSTTTAADKLLRPAALELVGGLINSGDNRSSSGGDGFKRRGNANSFTISPAIRLAAGESQRQQQQQQQDPKQTPHQGDSNLNLKHHSGPIYTNQFVIELSGGEQEARKLAEKHGFVYLNHILGDFYHLEHRRLARRSIELAEEVSGSIEEEPQVLKLERQVLKRRVKRDFLDIQPPGSSHYQHQFGASQPQQQQQQQRPQFHYNQQQTGANNAQLRPTQFAGFRPAGNNQNHNHNHNLNQPQYSRPANQAPNSHNAMSYSQRLYAPTTTTSSSSSQQQQQLLMMQQRQYLNNRIGAHPTPATPIHGTSPAGHLDPLETSASSLAAHQQLGGSPLASSSSSNSRHQRPPSNSSANLTMMPSTPMPATLAGTNHNHLYQVYANQSAPPPAAPFNDPSWPLMWYLDNGAKNGFDLNVQAAWKMGYTGKGIVITILDDGLEKDHPDLQANYDPLASFDINNDDADPMPRYDANDSNRHGTRCAGEVAAVPDNNICSIGIAYNSKVGGVRMLDGEVTDAVEARSLGLNNQHIHIYSASWGPDDNGKTVDGPGELATRAFIEGVTKGRQGLGSIFVFASGNGGREHDNCNCDGYTNSIWTLSISSATENGLVPWYIEACSSTLATTYSSGNHDERQIATTDLHHTCTSNHTGTSASAPLAAGICALVLESNPRLTWRDMQHIVVRTAKPANLLARDWRTNAMGRNVSHAFGYGLMDAAAMIQMARQWKTMPIQYACEVVSPPMEKYIPAKGYIELKLRAGCANVRYLEHVQSKVTLTASRRGDLHIYLTSPLGTRSTLLAQRPNDQAEQGFRNWPFMTVHSWGEEPNGSWTLEVHNGGKPQNRAYLKNWTLVLYGTYEDPNKHLTADSLDVTPLPPDATPAPPQRPAATGFPQPTQGGRGNPSAPPPPPPPQQRPTAASGSPPPPPPITGISGNTNQQHPKQNLQPPVSMNTQSHWSPGQSPPIPPPVNENPRPPVPMQPAITPTTSTQQPSTSVSSSTSSSYSTTFKTIVSSSTSSSSSSSGAGPTTQQPPVVVSTATTGSDRVVQGDFEVVVAPPGNQNPQTTRPSPPGDGEVLWSTVAPMNANEVPLVTQPQRQPDYTSSPPMKPPVDGSPQVGSGASTEAPPLGHDSGLDLNQLDLKQTKDYRSSGGQLVILPSNPNQELDSNNLNRSPTPVTFNGLNTASTNDPSSTIVNQIDGEESANLQDNQRSSSSQQRQPNQSGGSSAAVSLHLMSNVNLLLLLLATLLAQRMRANSHRWPAHATTS